jgi:hypothetical protein
MSERGSQGTIGTLKQHERGAYLYQQHLLVLGFYHGKTTPYCTIFSKVRQGLRAQVLSTTTKVGRYVSMLTGCRCNEIKVRAENETCTGKQTAPYHAWYMYLYLLGTPYGGFIQRLAL